MRGPSHTQNLTKSSFRSQIPTLVPARNSVRIEINDVGSLLLLSLPLPMFTLFLSFLGTLRSCFQTRAALQLEILALRH